jgi:hypothetical protein
VRLRRTAEAISLESPAKAAATSIYVPVVKNVSGARVPT